MQSPIRSSNDQASQPNAQPTLTRGLVRLVRTKPVADRDLQAAAALLLDAVANIAAGRNTPQGRKILQWARSCAPGCDLKALDAGRKAFVLGAWCHILEVDDLHRASVVHPGCVVVPALLALCEDNSGRLLLEALLHGFEACCRVGMAVGPAHYRIWHNTATCGPFGSAMAAAHLLQLDEDRTVDALGNAGSQSAGLWQFLDTGAETKHMHAGRGAEAGVVAAGLATAGLTGAPAILEGARGFFAATCPDGEPARVLADPDAPWQAHLTSIKPWPSCRHTHPAIDCALKLHRKMQDRSLSPSHITRVRIAAYPAALDLCDRPDPDTVYAAKFSLQHCIAAALSEGRVWFDSFEAPQRDRCTGLRSRVSVAATAEFAERYPVHWGSVLEVEFSNGMCLSEAVSDALGDPELPVSIADLRAKSRRLFEFGGIAQPDRLTETIMDMPAANTASDIVAQLLEAY